MNCKAGFAVVAFMAIWALGTAAVADRLKDMWSNFTLDPFYGGPVLEGCDARNGNFVLPAPGAPGCLVVGSIQKIPFFPEA